MSSIELQSAPETEFASEAAPGGFFHADYKRHEDLKQMLDSNKDNHKLEAMKRIIGMIAKGRDASDLFPAVVKNVVSKNIEVKKLVYVYLVRYAEEQQDLALLSISTFQRALKDPNQLIRASALRVLSSIRVPVIVPIMMLAIRDSVADMSPYVRKTAAHAIPKLYSLDPEQKDELVQVLEKLLSDRTTLVVGSAVMAFEEICPERIDLIHRNFRKLCSLLVDIEEWGQVVVLHMLTRYARTQFVDPNLNGAMDEPDRPFYDDEDDSDESDAKKNTKNKPPTLDPDHRLLMRNAKPLLQSRNAAVVMAVAQLFHHIAPRSEVIVVAKALVRLLRSSREVQSVVLHTIASMSLRRKDMFEPFLKSFFVRANDATHIKLLKLEILTNLATEASISIILREFQTYIASQDKMFVAATIQAIGRCASTIKEVTDTCLNGLVALLSNRDESVVAESVVVIKRLLQTTPGEHTSIIGQMARLVDSITVPGARAAILWLLGEYCERVPLIAPDVLRKMAKSFTNEEDIVKLQVLNLSTKLCLTNAKQCQLLCQYVFSLAKYDQNYDIRDRARFLRQFVFPTNENSKLARHAKKIFLASKPAPVSQSSYRDQDDFQLGTLSHYINAPAAGYHELPSFPQTAPDPSVRNVEPISPKVSTTPTLLATSRKTKPAPTKAKGFYSESESEDESESESEEESSGEDEEEEEEESQSEEEEKEVKKQVSAKPVKKETESEESEESSSEEDSDSEEDSSENEEEKVQPKKSSVAAPPPKPKSNLDLLLDLDDVMPALETPALTPSLGGFLSPMPDVSISPLSTGTTSSTSQVAPCYVATVPTVWLDQRKATGLQISYRYTRSQHLYSPSMLSIELTILNESKENVGETKIGRKTLPPNTLMHEFPAILSIPAGGTRQVTFGLDCGDSSQNVTFDLILGERSIPLTLKPPLGEMIKPVSMTESAFFSEQAKWRGMNEFSASVATDVQDLETINQRILVAANLGQIPSNEANVARFAGRTLSGKYAVLVTLKMTEKANLVVNCEKMVFGSMLLNELKEAVARS